MFTSIFIINLEHETQKRERVEEQLRRENMTYEVVRAVDGQNGRLEEYTFSVHPQWSDPFTHKNMTKGEIGCALSHYGLWKRIVDDKLPYTLILEDDVILETDFINTVTSRLHNVPEYDMLYLGRRRMNLDEEEIVPGIVQATYSYGTHAYVLSYQGAYKLIHGNYMEHLIPVDEYLPLVYDPHYPHTEYIPYFTPLSLTALSVTPLVVDICGGDDYKSTTYNTDPYVYSSSDSYLVLSVGTSPNDALSRFEESCRTYGHPYKILGRNTIWHGGNMAHETGGGQKINLLNQELSTWSETELERTVLFTDSYDVIFISHQKDVLRKYKELTQDKECIVFSSEPSCWPDASLASRYPSPHYLNSGGFIGKAKHILSILDNVLDNSDDQLYYTHQFLNRTDIMLDTNSCLFQTLNGNDIHIDQGKLVIPSRPCLLHGNGPSHVKRRLHSIANYVLGWSNTYWYCMTRQPSTPLIYVCSPELPELTYPSDQLLWKSFDLQHVVQDFLTTTAEYLFVIEPLYHITNPNTLNDLLRMNKTIVGPMVKKQSGLWSNFWGDISNTGYYQRSFDYMDIVNYRKKAVWNVPYLTGIYLIRRDFLESYPYVFETTTMDRDMEFSHNIRMSNHFMFVSNVDEYGYIEEEISLTNVLGSSWEKKYIHPDYLRYRNELTSICDEKCRDVFSFPLFTQTFCDEMIALCETCNEWSSGRSDVMDPRLNAYENVPTRDIHLHQLHLEPIWKHIVFTYIAPVAKHLYHQYKTKQVHIAFVAKYSMDTQRELSPHHDSSTYTINVCLNNEFEGGGCYFIRQDYFLEHRQIGFASIHPGRLTHYHEGKAITSGKRYILVSFID